MSDFYSGDADEQVVLQASVNPGQEEWLIDSGASCHVTYNKSLIIPLDDESSRTITVGNGNAVQVKLVGDLFLKCENSSIKLTEVNYAPNFTKNVLSLRKFIDGGCIVDKMDRVSMTIITPSRQQLVGFRRTDHLYYLQAKRYDPADNAGLVLATINKRSISLGEAHRLLGHADTRSVIKTIRDLGWKLSENMMDPCGPCAYAKAQAKAVPKTTLKQASSPGERLFVDFSGPYTPTVTGNTYWLLAVDDFSRKSWCMFAKRKSEIANLLQPLLAELQGAKKPVKYLRCDNAGENAKQLQDLCTSFGIELEFTAPYTPQQNGVVERAFVTLRNRGMAMMLDARLTDEMQNKLWGEAVYHASNVTNNILPMRRDTSPNVLFFGERRRFPELIEWGRVGYVTIRSRYVAKFQPKATKMVYVGMTTNHPTGAHRMYNPETNNVIVSQDGPSGMGE